jgi:hypothetical protein
MSNMRHLLESISNFSVADPKAPEVKEGEECDTCHKDPCECDDKDLAEALMQEYKYFVKEADPVAPPVAGQPAAGASPVAAVNPPGTGNPAVAGAPATNTATSQTGAAPKPGAPATPPAAGTPPPKPGAPATPPAAGTPPPKPGAPAAGTVTPPNPQQVKQQTDTLTKLLNNPAHPMNAELQALIKKAGSIPS